MGLYVTTDPKRPKSSLNRFQPPCVNAPEATAQTISSDCYLYTGDLGYVDEKGLHFAGRAKWVIKPKGYQVFPAQVEDHVGELR